MQHHEDSIATFVGRVQDRADIVAVIVDGSVAHGTERPDSDVDLCLVLTPEAFSRAWQQNRLSYVDYDGANYDGGYFDIKVVDIDYLRQAAQRGDDPVRAAFVDARVVWSTVDGLYELVAAIPRLPEDAWLDRMASFIAQLRLHGGYFLKQAVTLDNTFLRHHAAVHMVGAGGRALLALNRTLFQGQKYLDLTLSGLEHIPAGYAEAAAGVLQRPDLETGDAYRQLVEEFHPWPLDQQDTLSTFVRDNELSWFTGRPPIEYR